MRIISNRKQFNRARPLVTHNAHNLFRMGKAATTLSLWNFLQDTWFTLLLLTCIIGGAGWWAVDAFQLWWIGAILSFTSAMVLALILLGALALDQFVSSFTEKRERNKESHSSKDDSQIAFGILSIVLAVLFIVVLVYGAVRGFLQS